MVADTDSVTSRAYTYYLGISGGDRGGVFAAVRQPRGSSRQTTPDEMAVFFLRHSIPPNNTIGLNCYNSGCDTYFVVCVHIIDFNLSCLVFGTLMFNQCYNIMHNYQTERFSNLFIYSSILCHLRPPITETTVHEGPRQYMYTLYHYNGLYAVYLINFDLYLLNIFI